MEPASFPAFKEWQVVCDALASGRQSLILRKGGIHEGRSGFCFAHESFFLFPTRFHAQADHIREGSAPVLPEWKTGDTVPITHHAAVLHAVTLTRWDDVEPLEPFHIYTRETVRQRFDWQGKGMSAGSIHVALVEIRALPTPRILTYQASYGGCRSWIEIPPPSGLDIQSLLPVSCPQQIAAASSLIRNLALSIG
jgi:hypothetical protein